MDTEFGCYADEVIQNLNSTDFRNEYFDMSNTERLKFLNLIMKLLSDFDARDEEKLWMELDW